MLAFKMPLNKYQKDWIHLYKTLVEFHPRFSEKVFKDSLERKFKLIKTRLSNKNVSKETFITEAMKYFAYIGDSHTGFGMLHRLLGFRNIPVRVESFGGTYHVIKIAVSKKAFVLGKVISVNGISIKRIENRVKKFFPYENKVILKYAVITAVTSPDCFKLIGFNSNQKSMKLGIDIGGKVRNLILSVNNEEKMYNPIEDLNQKEIPISLLYLKSYWFEYLKDKDIIFFKYNRCLEIEDYPMKRLAKDMEQTINKESVRNIIIDIRTNGGGDSKVINPFLEMAEKYKGDIKFFVLISSATYSSGIINAIQMKELLGARFVGQNTGGKPNHYGHPKQLTLPRTKLQFTVSTKFFKLSSRTSPTLVPDIKITPQISHFVIGRDATMEKVYKLIK